MEVNLSSLAGMTSRHPFLWNSLGKTQPSLSKLEASLLSLHVLLPGQALLIDPGALVHWFQVKPLIPWNTTSKAVACKQLQLALEWHFLAIPNLKLYSVLIRKILSHRSHLWPQHTQETCQTQQSVQKRRGWQLLPMTVVHTVCFLDTLSLLSVLLAQPAAAFL